MEPAAVRALRDEDDLELVTVGRTSGLPHAVRLAFAFDGESVWVRTDERPAPPDASGVRRRTAREREPDWLRNLAAQPDATIRVGEARLAARYERSADAAADLERVVELMREKYGVGWVEDWYVDRGRVPVRLRILTVSRRDPGASAGEQNG